MKKFLSLCLALAICLSLAVPVFAASATPVIAPLDQDQYYFVQKGDTWSTISANYYGIAIAKALRNANSEALKETNGELLVGMTVTLPATLRGYARHAQPVAGSGETLYVVKTGDSLSKIAKSWYGRSTAYKDIYERNKDRILSNYKIYAGQVIVLPTVAAVRASEAKAAAAIANPVPTNPTPVIAASNQDQYYFVQKGDTWSTISANYYGAPYANALRAANSEALKDTNGKLIAGMSVTLPATLKGHARLARPVAGAGEKLYTVQKGDTLAGIAKGWYGDSDHLYSVFYRNKDRIASIDRVYAGQVIVMP